MEIDEDDAVVDMISVKEGYDILTVSALGYGKRSDVNEYRLQTRGGKGVKAGVFNEQTGVLVCMKLVKEDEDVMLIADNGVVIRTRANEISRIGRDTKGVKIMKLNSGSIATVAVVPHSEEEPEEDENGENVETVEAGETANTVENVETAENESEASGEGTQE